MHLHNQELWHGMSIGELQLGEFSGVTVDNDDYSDVVDGNNHEEARSRSKSESIALEDMCEHPQLCGDFPGAHAIMAGGLGNALTQKLLVENAQTRVKFNHRVVSVDYNDDTIISVRCEEDDKDGYPLNVSDPIYKCKTIVSTIPVGVLKKVSLIAMNESREFAKDIMASSNTVLTLNINNINM